MPTVGSEMYEIDGRKYIDVDGKRIKIPFRYGHISGVTVNGFKSLYELKKGDTIKELEVVEKKWKNTVYYVLKSIHIE
jgi:hypothetical protein